MTAFSTATGTTRDNALTGKTMKPSPVSGNSVLENLRRRWDNLYERILRIASPTSETPLDLTNWNPVALGIYGTLPSSNGVRGVQCKRRAAWGNSADLDAADMADFGPFTTFLDYIENPYLGNAALIFTHCADLSNFTGSGAYRHSAQPVIVAGPNGIPALALRYSVPKLTGTDSITFTGGGFLWELV